MALGDKQGKALTTTARPSSVDVRAQQINVFPLDAFEFTNPNKKKATDEPIKLSMKEGWVLDIGAIQFENLPSEVVDTLDSMAILAEDNALKIKNTDGQVLITGETVDILARELNLQAETISLAADKIIFSSGENLEEEVLVIDSGQVKLNVPLNGVSGSFTGELHVGDNFDVDVSGFLDCNGAILRGESTLTTSNHVTAEGITRIKGHTIEIDPLNASYTDLKVDVIKGVQGVKFGNFTTGNSYHEVYLWLSANLKGWPINSYFMCFSSSDVLPGRRTSSTSIRLSGTVYTYQDYSLLPNSIQLYMPTRNI